MARSMRNASMKILAAVALLGLAGCPSPEGEPNPKPAPEQPPAQQQQPAAQQPAAQAPAAGAAGAGGAAAAAPAAQVSPEALAEAKQTFSTVCATCHGPQGAGDGPASAGFPVKPRSFNDAEWQKSVTDEHIAKVIVEGGPAVGKSPLMPGNPQLAGKPEVVSGLVQLVREMGKGGAAK
ncbi:c-type cytochrome [Vulgatibacter sp.]|uniref:c-type cytochrome n=1 Tax=Vulgatibacter sp. TaxID=1971226 RepID=UPI0035696DC4